MASNELYHWKYIKRERTKSGKWRYYYPGYDKTKVYDKAEVVGDQILDQTDKTIDSLLRSKLVKEYSSPVDVVKDKLGYDEKKRYESAKNWATVEKETADYMDEKIDEVEREMKSDGVIDAKEKSQLDLFRTSPEAAKERYAKWKPIVDQMLDEYSKTPLYQIEKMKDKVENGKKKVSEILNRLKNR